MRIMVLTMLLLLLAGQRGRILDFNQRLEIAIDVAHGLTYLHLYAGDKLFFQFACFMDPWNFKDQSKEQSLIYLFGFEGGGIKFAMLQLSWVGMLQ